MVWNECSWFISVNFTTNLIGFLTMDHLGRFGGESSRWKVLAKSTSPGEAKKDKVAARRGPGP